MPYSPFNIGNAMLQGEQIMALRDARNPNSLQNQLLAAKVRQAQQPAAGIEYGKLNYGDYTPESIDKFIKAGGGRGNIGILERYAAPQIIDIGGVAHRVDRSGSGYKVTKVPLSDLQTEMTGEASLKGAGAYAAEEQKQRAQAGLPSNLPYTNPVQPGELNLGTATGSPVTAAGLAGDKIKAQEKAKTEAERESPDFKNKQAIRESDSANAINLIDEMLTPKDDGEIYASYAYGKANVLMPETAKPQEWIDAEAKRDQLVSMLQLENVSKLKGTGPITEPEQQVLKAAMTVLQNPRISVKLVERELRRVRAMFSEWKKQARDAQGKEPTSNQGDVINWSDL